MTAMGRWGVHIPAQSCKVYLIQEAEVQNPAGMSGHGQQSVFIQLVLRLAQVVPLLRRHIITQRS